MDKDEAQTKLVQIRLELCKLLDTLPIETGPVEEWDAVKGAWKVIDWPTEKGTAQYDAVNEAIEALNAAINLFG